MKIFIMAGIFPPDIGGPANYIPKLALAFIEKGYEIEILCFSDTTKHDIDKTFNFHIRRIKRNQNFLIRELRTIWTGWLMARNSDLIFSNGNDFKSMIIAMLCNKPHLHKIVGDTAWERAQNRGWFSGTIDDYQLAKKNLKLRFLDWVKILPLKRSFGIITPSSYLKGIVNFWGVKPSRIYVIYNSFEPLVETTASIELTKNLDLSYMCTICRLVPWKGVAQLISVLKKFPKLGLIIVGDGPLENDLKNYARELNVADRVIFAGRQERKNIKFFIEQSSFFILNSSYEGLPHVVLEAMSCKRLVVASKVGGTPELVIKDKTGILFEYGNSQTLENSINKALNEDNSLLIEGAYNFILNSFSYERMIAETESVFQSAKQN